MESWSNDIRPSEMFLSVITLYELEHGALLIARRDPVQATLLRGWLGTQLATTFDGRVLSIDGAVALRSAALNVPDPRPIRDCLIAATALVHDMTVVTRNIRDFATAGVRIINPWASPQS